MNADHDVAIIGAGPYGLSIAAHLRARGIDFRIFGRPMDTWRSRMPAGMLLKSEGFASNLSDPQGHFTLSRYCRSNELTYDDTQIPIPRATFSAYGVAFARQIVPSLEEKMVSILKIMRNSFQLQLDDGEVLTARHVVVATGLTHFAYIPTMLNNLPGEMISHSSDHLDLSRFQGREVIVIGGGASAMDLMAALHDVGSSARLVARRTRLAWTDRAQRPLWKRWYPKCGLGPGWRNRFYERAPMAFRLLPEAVRLETLSTWLGPSGGWPVRERVLQMPVLLSHTVIAAEFYRGRVQLRLAGADGREYNLPADHVIAATGYRVNLKNLPFLSDELHSMLSSGAWGPKLSRDFQSAVPGLYFTGLTAAATFGPVMRFVLGSCYTAHRLAGHFGKVAPGRRSDPDIGP